MTREELIAASMLTPEVRQSLIDLLDREMRSLEVMRACGWPLATPRELIPPAFRAERKELRNGQWVDKEPGSR